MESFCSNSSTWSTVEHVRCFPMMHADPVCVSSNSVNGSPVKSAHAVHLSHNILCEINAILAVVGLMLSNKEAAEYLQTHSTSFCGMLKVV